MQSPGEFFDLVIENIRHFAKRGESSDRGNHHRRRQSAFLPRARAPGGDRTGHAGFDLKMDGKSHPLYKPVMIGRIAKDGRILPVSVTDGLVPPEPWSPWLAATRPKAQTAEA